MAAYGASAKPSVPDAVACPRAASIRGGRGSGRVVIASYLLAPGFFHDQLAKAGADLVTEPLLPSPVLAEIALDRYDAAVARSAAAQRAETRRGDAMHRQAGSDQGSPAVRDEIFP